MKPFNIEEAKAGKPVCTRTGHHVRILCYDADLYQGGGCRTPIIALIRHRNVERIGWYSEDGKYLGVCEHELDLFMKAEEITGFVNVELRDGVFCAMPTIYADIDTAKAQRRKQNVATISIKWRY